MSEKDRKEFKTQKSNALLEAFNSQAKLDSLKKEYYQNIQNGMGLYIQATVDAVKICLKKSNTDAQVKFRALLFLKESMDFRQKQMSTYVATKILSRLKEIAKMSKKPNERKKPFSKDSKATIIDDFYQLLIECLNEWNVQFPIEAGTQMTPSQYKKVWSELLELGIRAPEKKFFIQPKPAREPSVTPQEQKPKPVQQEQPIKQTASQKPNEQQQPKVQQVQSPPAQGSILTQPVASGIQKKTITITSEQSKFIQKAKEQVAGAINYFVFLQELIQPEGDAQLVIDMSGDSEQMLNVFNEDFIYQLSQLPDGAIESYMLEDVIQIRTIFNDMLADIKKLSRKPQLYPTFQKKYFKQITSFLRRVENHKKEKKDDNQDSQRIKKQSSLNDNQSKKTITEPSQIPQLSQPDFQPQFQPGLANDTFPPQDQFGQAVFNQQGFGASPAFDVGFGQTGIDNQGFGQQMQEPDPNGFEQPPFMMPGFEPQGFDNGFPPQPGSGQNLDFGQTGFGNQGFASPAFDNFTGPQFPEMQQFPPPMPLGQNQNFEDQYPGFPPPLGNQDFNPEVPFGLEDNSQRQGGAQEFFSNQPQGFDQPFEFPTSQFGNDFTNFDIAPRSQNRKKSGNPFQAPIQEGENSQYIEHNPFEQNANQLEFETNNRFGDNQINQSQEAPWQMPEFDKPFDFYAPNLQQNKDSTPVPTFDLDPDFQFNFQNSKDQSPATAHSYIKSQGGGGPFSNIFDIENKPQQGTEKRIRGDSVSEAENASQIPRNENFEFQDYQDFNLGNLGASISSQKVDKNLTRGSNDSKSPSQNLQFVLDYVENKFTEPQGKDRSKKSASVLVTNVLDTLQVVDTHSVEENPQPNQAQNIKQTDKYEIQEPKPSQKEFKFQPSPQNDSKRKQDYNSQKKVQNPPPPIIQYIEREPQIIIQYETLPKVETLDQSVQVETQRESIQVREDIGIKIVVKPDPQQELRHQQESAILREEITRLRQQHQMNQQEILNLRQELKTSQQNEQFIKKKQAQYTDQTNKIVQQFTLASEQLNKARHLNNRLNEKLGEVEEENKVLREQMTEHLQEQRLLSEGYQSLNNKHNKTIRALGQIQRLRCNCQSCGFPSYIEKILKIQDSTQITEEVEVQKPKKSVIISPQKQPFIRKKLLEFDYNLFVKLYRLSAEQLSSKIEDFKYACLVNRGVLFENASLQVGMISKYSLNEAMGVTELQITLNIFNKTGVAVNIGESIYICPSNNQLNQPQSLTGILKAKQAIRQNSCYSYIEGMETPLFSISIDQDIYKVMIPALPNKFIDYQQIDLQYWIQNWRTQKDAGGLILQMKITQINKKIMRTVTDLKRFWSELIEIRTPSKNPYTIKYGVIGKLNQLHDFAIKFVEKNSECRLKIMINPLAEEEFTYLIQQLVFTLSI